MIHCDVRFQAADRSCQAGCRVVAVDRVDARFVVPEEDLTDQFAAAPYPRLGEDGLQVLLHGVRRDEQPGRDLARRVSLQHQSGQLALARRQAFQPLGLRAADFPGLLCAWRPVGGCAGG